MSYTKLADGSRMYFIEKGDGPVIVFQHGFLGSSWLFEAQVEYFAGRGYHTIAFDLKGHGRSDKSKTANYLLPEFAQELNYALNQIIGKKKITLLGHSMGGMIALCYATDPKLSPRLEGLILQATAPKLENPVLDQYIEGLRSGTLKVTDRSTIESIMVMLCFNKAYQDSHPDVVKEFVNRTLTNENYVALATMEAIVRKYDVTDRLSRITVPTLVLHGENDIFIPPASSKVLAKAIPHAELVVCKGPIGHMLQYECTKTYHAAIEKYLRRIIGKTG
jgi:pimeloyl-ACP methyl ester carboxylesterase